MLYRSLILSVSASSRNASLTPPPSTPATFPFALIPIMPNFPLFYVLWRAWSHYKAWRGATYIEQLLKMGMIVEKPSAELDKIYKSQGSIDGPTGGKDHAPDETSSEGVEKGKISEQGRVNEGVRDEASDLPEQAKGQGAAPDGTSTPKSMVYSATSKPSSEGASASDTVMDAAGPAQSPTTKKDTRHPAMLLSKEQIPELAKAMELRANEVMDVTRAVEQADGRARAADKRDATGQDGGKTKDEDGKSGKPGTT